MFISMQVSLLTTLGCLIDPGGWNSWGAGVSVGGWRISKNVMEKQWFLVTNLYQIPSTE